MRHYLSKTDKSSVGIELNRNQPFFNMKSIDAEIKNSVGNADNIYESCKSLLWRRKTLKN